MVSLLVQSVVYVAIAVLITVGVTYNSVRIQLSERARDLASLRILGFTNGEVSYILIGETVLLVLFAQPLGWLLGTGLAAATRDLSVHANALFTSKGTRSRRM